MRLVHRNAATHSETITVPRFGYRACAGLLALYFIAACSGGVSADGTTPPETADDVDVVSQEPLSSVQMNEVIEATELLTAEDATRIMGTAMILSTGEDPFYATSASYMSEATTGGLIDEPVSWLQLFVYQDALMSDDAVVTTADMFAANAKNAYGAPQQDVAGLGDQAFLRDETGNDLWALYILVDGVHLHLSVIGDHDPVWEQDVLRQAGDLVVGRLRG